MATRIKIPEKQKQLLLYESAFACVVCQKRGAHIHHIDRDNSHNDSDNLVVLCQEHHDEAHTKRELSQNLTPERLKVYKQSWLEQVSERRCAVASVEGQKRNGHEWLNIGVTWGYINHKRVIQLVTDEILGSVNRTTFRRCVDRGITDARGVVIRPESFQEADTIYGNTMYDWFPPGDDQSLHLLYSDFVDKISNKVRPIQLDEQNWNRTFIGNVLEEGQFIFFIGGQNFKTVAENNVSAHVRVTCRKKKIELQYFVDTFDMFGTTSISVSFFGRATCSSFLQIKSVEKTPELWKIACTPIALGVSFRDYR